VRGGFGGVDRRPATIHFRESSEWMTSSISKCDAVFTALPWRYISSTISSNNSFALLRLFDGSELVAIARLHAALQSHAATTIRIAAPVLAILSRC
jgi:hypothetical protein